MPAPDALPRRPRLGFAGRALLVLALAVGALETLHWLASDDLIPRVTEAEAEAALASADRPAVLFFSVTGCHFCSGSLKLLRDVARETGDDFRYVEVDLEDARALGARYGVQGVPTLLVFDSARRLRGRASAVTTRAELERLLN
jgi:thioredoxin 1